MYVLGRAHAAQDAIAPSPAAAEVPHPVRRRHVAGDDLVRVRARVRVRVRIRLRVRVRVRVRVMARVRVRVRGRGR